MNHVTPWSRGGATDNNNCELLCKTQMIEKAGSRHDININIQIEKSTESAINAESQNDMATSVQRFKNDISHGNIIKEGKDQGNHFQCGLASGIIKATELIRAGEVEAHGKGIVIYLTNIYNTKKWILSLRRSPSGELFASMDILFLAGVWGAGDGALRKA